MLTKRQEKALRKRLNFSYKNYNQNPAKDGRKISFTTGSSYNGQWNSTFKCMEGFGIYTFRDGAFYRGTFQRGLFHGWGRITLALPGISIMGYFENGIMKTADEIVHFPDGLPANIKVNLNELQPDSHGFYNYPDKIDMSDWKYLQNVHKQTCQDIINRNTAVHERTCKQAMVEDCTAHHSTVDENFNICMLNANEKLEPCGSADTLQSSFGDEALTDQKLSKYNDELEVSISSEIGLEQTDSSSDYDFFLEHEELSFLPSEQTVFVEPKVTKPTIKYPY